VKVIEQRGALPRGFRFWPDADALKFAEVGRFWGYS
jgi:hypothetical protein